MQGSRLALKAGILFLALLVGAGISWFRFRIPNPATLTTSFVSAVETLDSPESQSFIASHREKVPFGRYVFPAVLLSYRTTGEERFNDKGVDVYRRFLIVEVTNQLNQRIAEKFLITAYLNLTSRSWKVIYFGPSEIQDSLAGTLFGSASYPALYPDFSNSLMANTTTGWIAGGLADMWGGNPSEAFRKIDFVLRNPFNLNQTNIENLKALQVLLTEDYGLSPE